MVSGQTNWTQGEKTLLYMRVAFEDDPAEPVSAAAAAQAIIRANDFFLAQSYGTLSVTGVVTPLLALPHPKSFYTTQPPLRLLTDARMAARAAGYETDDYDLDLVRNNPIPGYTFAGTSSVGTKNLWLQHGSFGVFVHELGHNLGMHHSSLWRSRDGNPAGPGQHIVYGDAFDTMGQPQSNPDPYDFNVVWKTRLGWLAEAQVPRVENSGTFRIFAYDQSALESGRIYGLRVRKDATRDYWLSHRRALAGNPWLAQGLLLHWNPWPGSFDDTQLLDATPASAAGATDAALLIGRTFSDWEAGIHLTPVARGTEAGEPWIEVYVQLGNPSENNSPTVQISADPQVAGLNQEMELTAVASDPDEDELVYDWDLGDGTIAPNQAAITHQWVEAGEYVVRCRVSDRRGGVGSASVLMVVGEASTLRISGTATRNGTPLEGVLVKSDGGKVARTTSSGSYTLTGLSAGAHTVTASLPGHELQALFTNPLHLDTNVNDLNFVATPLPPAVDLQPFGSDRNAGEAWSLAVMATGLAPLQYQWQKDGQDLPGADESSLAWEAVAFPDEGDYRVLVWNQYGTNVSEVAALRVAAPPVLLSQPQDLVANLGGTASFSFTVTGREPMMIQWLVPAGAFEDATNATYTVSEVRAEDAGPYVAMIVNDDGFVITSNAFLLVNHPPVPAQTSWERLPGAGVLIPVSALLGTDPDGDSLSLASFEETTALGGTLIQEDAALRYSPPASLEVDDQFAFTVSDGRGGETDGVATVTVFPESARPRAVTIEQPTQDELIITFHGAEDRIYSVVHADRPDATEWHHLGLAQHLGAGTFSFTDTPPAGTTTRYYRLRFP